MVTMPHPLFPATKVVATGCITFMLSIALPAAAAPMFATTTLVSDQAGASVQDPSLVNGWGMSYAGGGPFWVSSNGGAVSTVYMVDPATDATTKVPLTVSIPGSGSVTGQVFNGNGGAFNGDAFLFVSEDGTVSGWRGALGTAAETLVSASSANVYKGAAISLIGGNSYLYAANFHSGGIDVFKGSNAAPDLTGAFVDPALPAGYAPFNIQGLSGELLVAYAQQDAAKTDEVAGVGLGYVDAFDLQGNFLRRVASGGNLNAPWGLTIAPGSWGELAGKLLVGNFGDGRISAYDFATGVSAGQLLDVTSNALVIDGLWGIMPGNNGSAGSSDRLYFAAGPNSEANGTFGVIAAVPAPATAWLLGTGCLGLMGWKKRKSVV